MVRIFAACVAGLLASTVLAAPLSSSLRNSDVTDVAAPAAAIPASKAVVPENQVAQDIAPESPADAGSASKQKEKGAGKKDDKGGEEGKEGKEDKEDRIKFTIKKPFLMKWSGSSSTSPTNVQLALQAGDKVLKGSKPVTVIEDLL